MIGYVLSLGLMVLLSNVPMDADFFGYGGGATFPVDGLYSNEPLPIITMHELPQKRTQHRPNVEAIPQSISKTTSAVAERKEDLKNDSAALPPITSLRPAALAAAAAIPSEEETRKLLRFTTGPPSVDVPPKVRVGSMIVRYPISALKKAIQGLVIVRFTVEPTGRASHIEIVKGLDPACDEEVMEAVERARFLPGMREGRRVPAYSQMTIRFVLADADSRNVF